MSILNLVPVAFAGGLDQIGDTGSAMPLMVVGVVFLIIALIGLAATVFWIMMLVHAITKPIENKALWIIILLLTGVIGAIIYYFVVKKAMDHSAIMPVPVAPVPMPAPVAPAATPEHQVTPPTI